MIPMLKNTFQETRRELAFYLGLSVNISLLLVTRFDGFGNSRVFFLITDGKEEVDYEKYDSAASAYNIKIEGIARSN